MSTLILLLAVLPAQFADIASYALKKQNAESRLEALLKEWEKADQKIHEIHYTIQVTTEDRVLKDKQRCRIEGFVKRHNLARINLNEKTEEPILIAFLNDRILEIYKCETKEKLSWALPDDFPEKWFEGGWLGSLMAGAFQDNREFFCFEFPVGKIHEEFESSLRKEDDNWAYIEMFPKSERRKADVKKMEVVLNQKTHLVRQVRFFDCNGNLSIYDFQKLDINPTPPITLESISKNLPKGYKELSLDALFKAPDSKSDSQ
jgi:outer membrane lipoprotein-sorting protein